MKSAVRYIVLIFAVISVVAVLSVWKKHDREAAIQELENRYDADVTVGDDDFHIGCSSELLVDLVDFASVVNRVGEPSILDLTGAPNLESFSGFEILGSVKSLIAIDCPKLVSAKGVMGHPGLEELVLTDSANFRDASEVRDMRSVLTLDFSGCREMESFEISRLPLLENLYLSRCRKIKAIDLTQLSGLRQLYLDGCSNLESIEGLDQQTKLTDLDVSNATTLQRLDGIEKLAGLIVLDMRNVDISDYGGIGKLPSLRVLRMGGQDSIETLEVFSGLNELREIHLEACPNFRSIKGIPASVSQYAGFTHCPKLTSLSGIGASKNLEQLDLTGCRNLVDVIELSQLENLVQLSLVKCRQVTDITPVKELEKLVIVMLGGSGVIPASIEDLETANKDIIFDFAVGE